MSRQCLVGFLVLLMVFLTACTSQAPLPAGTGQLLSEKSQVFFQKSAQQSEEVAQDSYRTASTGDEMWTQKQGRALLTFPDLWVRIYDDTELRTQDVMPSSIKMTLGAGAMLVGEIPQALERVEVVVGSPPRARIVLAGTLTMIVCIPSENVVLVRTFDGKVDVFVLASGQSIQSSSDSNEWVRIGSDDRIETPAREVVQALARRLGFWDLYHQIEQDATAFGPPPARIPAERVTMTFVETPTASSIQPPPTPRPIPTPFPPPPTRVSATPTPPLKVPSPPAMSAYWSDTIPCQPTSMQPGSWSDIVNNRIEIRSSWLRNQVLLDGGISTAQEWSDANCYDLVLGNQGAGFTTVRSQWWIKNDAEWLYLLMRSPVGAGDNAWIGYYWPHPYTGRWKYSDVGVIGLDGEVFDGYGWNETEWNDDTKASPPGRNDVQGLATRDTTYAWFEFRKALNSRDGYDWDWPAQGTVGTEGDLLFGVWDSITQTAPRLYVKLILGSEQTGASKPLLPTPTSTSARIPVLCRPGVLYCEDFEEGLAQDWRFTDEFGNATQAGWKLIQEGGNRLISGTGHNWAALLDHSWEDYLVRFRVRLMQGTIHFTYRLTWGPTGEPIRYFIGFHEGGLYVTREVRGVFTNLTSVGAEHALNRWHEAEIVGWGGHLQVYVDGKLELDYTDSNPLLRGTIAFETLDNSSAQVDDIEVLPAGAPPASGRVQPPPVPPTPTRTPTPKPPAPAPPIRTPTPTPTPFVACSPEHTVIEREDCTVLSWDVRNAQAVYLDGMGVTGREDRKVCPSETHTYELRVVTYAGDRSCRMVVEVRATSKPVISDIEASDIVSIGGLHEPECGSSKVGVSARVTSRYRLAKVQMWRSDSSTWSDMVSQGKDMYVSIQNFAAGNDFRVRAEDEFGNATETDTLPSKCMRVGFIVNKLSGRCIDAKGSPAVDNGAPLQLWDCDFGWAPNQTDQRWGITSDGFIQNALSGRCVDARGSPAVDNGAPLQLWDCEFGWPSAQTDQKWELTADGFIRNQLSGKCIDVMNSSGIDYEAVPGVNNGAQLQLWDCEASSNTTDQKWEWR